MKVQILKKIVRPGNDWVKGLIVDVTNEYGHELIKAKKAKEIKQIKQIEVRDEPFIPNEIKTK